MCFFVRHGEHFQRLGGGGGSFACAAESDVVLNTTNFDEPFLTALIPLLNAIEGISDKAKLDTGDATANNKLTAEEIAKVTTLDLSSASNKTSITSLKGIEYFTALTTLNVTGCTGLTELDVTALTSLTSLDVSGCSALTWLKYYCDTKVTGYSLTVYSKQLTLDGSINMAFYVPISDTSVTKSATFSGGASGGTFRSDLTDTKDETTYYAFSGEVTSIQMADPITAEIHVGDKTVTITGYTVEKYLQYLVDNAPYNTYVYLMDLVNAIKDYGHYAQAILSKTNADSYGEHQDMTASTANLGTTVDNGDELSSYAITNNTDKTVSYTLDLDSKITFHVYLPNTLTGADSAASKVAKMGETTTSGKITKTGTYGESANTGVTPKADGSSYALSFPDISAHELDNKYTITVGSDGDSKTIEIYPLSYVKTILTTNITYDQAGLTDEKHFNPLKQAVLAFYNYYKATVAYRADPEATTESTGSEGTEGSGEN